MNFDPTERQTYGRDGVRDHVAAHVADHNVWEQRIVAAMIKVQAPNMALQLIEDAIQTHGGAGVTTGAGPAAMYAGKRILRLVDGPDDVHARAIARNGIGRVRQPPRRRAAPRANARQLCHPRLSGAGSGRRQRSFVSRTHSEPLIKPRPEPWR